MSTVTVKSSPPPQLTPEQKAAKERYLNLEIVYIAVIIILVIVIVIIAVWKSNTTQLQGTQGNQGIQGNPGVGQQGDAGPKGDDGPEGPEGPPGLNGGGWIATRDVYVDGSTTVPQNLQTPGTIDAPFKTISQAIAYINGFPAQNANDWVRGFTVYIAGNTYNEDLLIDVTFNRITLSGMGDVIITSPTAALYNITVTSNAGGSSFGTSLGPTLTIESITSIDISRTTELLGLFVGSPASFRLTAGIQASVDNLAGAQFLNLVINAKISGDVLSTYTAAGTAIGYQFYNSVIVGSFLGNSVTNVVLIQSAINTAFLSNVTSDIGMASSCVFENGVVLFNSGGGAFNAAPGHGHKVGFRNCQINRSGLPQATYAIEIDNSASGLGFVVDTFTNAWVTGYSPLTKMANYAASGNSPTTAYNFGTNADGLIVLGATPVKFDYNTGASTLNNATNNYMLYGVAATTVELSTSRVINGPCVIRNLHVQIDTTNVVVNAYWTALINVNGSPGVLTSVKITTTGVDYSTANPATDSYFVLSGPGSGISLNIVGTNAPTATTARASFDVVPLY